MQRSSHGFTVGRLCSSPVSLTDTLTLLLNDVSAWIIYLLFSVRSGDFISVLHVSPSSAPTQV